MKKLVALLIILAAFFSLNNNTAFSQPQLKVHLTGGYNVPLPDLKGELPPVSVDDSNSFGMKSGFNAGADVKYYLGKKRNVGITLGLTYNSFSNSVDSTSYTQKAKINDFSVGLGVEYSFIPKGKTQPYLGLEFTGNFFSGDFTSTVAGTETKFTLKSASRFGIAIGGGIDFAFSKSVGANIGVKYHMANLIGKDYDTTTSIGSTEFPLNDKEYTVGTTTVPAKNISYIQLSAGLSFFFNHPKKVAKK